MDGYTYSALSVKEQELISLASRAALLLGWPELCLLEWWRDFKPAYDREIHLKLIKSEIEFLVCKYERGHNLGRDDLGNDNVCTHCGYLISKTVEV